MNFLIPNEYIPFNQEGHAEPDSKMKFEHDGGFFIELDDAGVEFEKINSIFPDKISIKVYIQRHFMNASHIAYVEIDGTNIEPQNIYSEALRSSALQNLTFHYDNQFIVHQYEKNFNVHNAIEQSIAPQLEQNQIVYHKKFQCIQNSIHETWKSDGFHMQRNPPHYFNARAVYAYGGYHHGVDFSTCQQTFCYLNNDQGQVQVCIFPFDFMSGVNFNNLYFNYKNTSCFFQNAIKKPKNVLSDIEEGNIQIKCITPHSINNCGIFYHSYEYQPTDINTGWVHLKRQF